MTCRKRGRVPVKGIARIRGIWNLMFCRCYKPTQLHYDLYGGRGIDVCDEWKDREAFVAWAASSGYADNLTLDRIDNSKGYSPENCRWATRKQQANNRRSCKYVQYHGRSVTISELAEIAGIPYSTALVRHQRGWTPDRIVNQKLQTYRFKDPVQAAENRRRVTKSKWKAGDYDCRDLPQRRKNYVCNSSSREKAVHEKG